MLTLDEGSVAIILFAVFGLVMLVAFGFVLRWERREFARQGKAHAWLQVRLAMIPIALVTAAALVLPARAVSGPEGLAVFYLLLFSAVPVLWVGLHWIAGRFARPALRFGDSLQLAVLPPAFAIAAVIVAHQLQPLAWTLAGTARHATFASAQDAPAAHRLVETRRYATPSGDVVTAHWQAGPEVRIERIDLVDGSGVQEDAGRGSLSGICQEPGGIHLVHPAAAAPSSLVVYWHDGRARLQRSSLTPPAPPAEIRPFAVRWNGDDFALPEPFPRRSVLLGRPLSNGSLDFDDGELQIYQPGESIEMNCLSPGWHSKYPVAGVRVRVGGLRATEPVWLESLREATAPATPY